MKPKNLFKQLLPSLRGRVRVGLSPLHLIGGRLLLAMMLAIVGVTRSMAQEAYAVYTENNSTLTFYYDTQRSSRTGTTYDLNTATTPQPGWSEKRESVTSVVFASSFANARPTRTSLWFSGMTNLTSITGISYLNTSQVTTMSCMFCDCSSLTSLDLSGFNTTNVTDMFRMFDYCSGLTSLDLSSFNTAKVTDMSYMFRSCTALTSLDLSGFNTANVTNMGSMFWYSSNLTSLNLSGWNTTNVTDMSRLFSNCSSLTSLNLSGWNTANVKHMEEMFDYCTELTSLNLSGWNTQNVTYMENMFQNCDKLTSLNLSGWNTANVTDMSNMFKGCSDMSSLDLSGWNTEKVTTMESMFQYCRKLINLDLSSFNTAKVTNMNQMFYGCNNLTNLDLSSFNTAKVTNMNQMFCGCYNLTNLDLSDWNTGNVTNMNSMFYGSSLTNLDLSGWNTGNVTDMKEMFRNCTSLTSINLSGWNAGNVTDMSYMFCNCSSLTSLDLSGINPNNATTMNSMFYGCSNLTSLDLSSFNTCNVTYMTMMFYDCQQLVTIYVSERWSTTNVTSSAYMFHNCYKLVGGNGTSYFMAGVKDISYAHIDVAGNPGYFTDIAYNTSREAYAVLSGNNTKLTFYFDNQKSSRTGTVYDLNASGNTPGWNSRSSSVTEVVFDPSFASARPTITYMWFSNMTNLTTITGIEYLHVNRVTDMKWMFAYCEKLTSLDLSGFNATNATSMYGMFDGCSALTSLDARYLSSDVVTDLRYMFYDCLALESLLVSNWYIGNATNMQSMFENCRNLTELNLNGWSTKKVTNMSKMFCGCSKLTTISVGEGWSTASVVSSDNMFSGSTKLVGGNGTTWDESHLDKAYARVDIDGSPGYLTSYLSEGAEPYAVLSSDKTTLTFYYDNQIRFRAGTQYTIDPVIAPGWAVNKETITTVEFHELFANYHGLTSTMGMFAGLKNLTQINHLERLNTENVTDMSKMFSGCYKLTSVNVFNFDTGKVTDMSGMFENCFALTSLFVATFNTENVENMEGMFRGCRTLPTLDLSYINTSKVKNMKQMFMGCSSLTSITNMNFNTEAVENMDAMFASCSSLTSLSLPSTFNTTNVTNMHSMFSGCSALTSLNLSYLRTSNVATMERMFSGCSALTTLTLTPSIFNTQNVTNMHYMFQNCSSLESLDLSRFNTENVIIMTGMFDGCGCPTLDVTSFNTSKVINTASMFANTSATTLNLTNFDMGKVVNCSKMFAGASNLTTIYCEDTWACNQADSVFVDCTSLKGAINYNSAKISGDYANPVTGYFSSKSYAVLSEDGTTLTFYHDFMKDSRPGTKYILNASGNAPGWYGAQASITTVVFDNSFYYARPTNTKRWFFEMANLETITNLKYLHTENVADMSYMFNGCSKLTSLDLSNFNTEKVTDMSYMFVDMTSITTLNLGAFKPQNVTNMSYMFYGDNKLKTIYVSSTNWTTNNVTISAGMFSGCNDLVGGNGTVYDSSHADVNYAHIDVAGNPGYLTEKKDAYAVQSTDKKTLTFYYDYMKDSREGTVYEVPKVMINAGWRNNQITTIDFDESFADYDGLTSAFTMFSDMTALTEINHLERLNTENATDMQYMFSGCTKLTTLDLSGFNTKKVTSMSYMFYGSTALTTIYVGANWDVSKVTTYGANMFTNCTNLVGMNGTTYDSNHVDVEYARIDGLDSQNGYLSAKVEPYAVYSGTTLTFYYDNQRFVRTGTTYDLNTRGNDPGWYSNGTYTNVTNVVFDSSFANVRPTSARRWFSGMAKLTSITGIRYLHTDDITEMRYMFSGCSSLTSLDVSSWNTGNVNDMEGLFQNCRSLTNLDVSGWNTESVTVMSYMFTGCSSLTSLEVSGWNTESVTSMYYLFDNCSSLTNLDLSGWNTAKVKSMSYMFDGCSSLATIYVGNGWTTNALASSSFMFTDCTSLVGGSGTAYDSNHVDAAYAHIDGGTGNPGYLTAAPYAVVSEDCTTLTFYNDDFSHAADGLLCYMNKASQTPDWFSYRSGITNVVFDESFASARPTTMYSWFYDMKNLTTFTGMENLNTSEVTSMGMTFASCNSLTTLDLSNWNTAKVTSMYGMFNGSSKLTTVYVGKNWSTTQVTSSDYMFTFCISLVGGSGTKYEFGNEEDKTYAHVDGGTSNPGYFWAPIEAYAVYDTSNTTLTFYYDSNRASRTGTVYDLNTGTTQPGWYTYRTSITNVVFDESFADARPTTTYRWFAGMTKLTLLDLHNLNTANVTDMTSMFSGCTVLLTIYVGDGWSTESVTSSRDMFGTCPKLVGGAGTEYSTNCLTAEYAHIDGGDDNPGYFTEYGAIEAYAVFNGTAILNFYYDDQKITRSLISRNTVYNLNSGTAQPGWYDNRTSITMVNFDASFADARPTSTYGWFLGMTKVTNSSTQTTRIYNIQNLNTSAVTNMGRMFYGCTGLTSLDLSGFNTENVTNMSYMFYNCSKLSTLDVSGFDVSKVTDMGRMFYGCKLLESLDVSGFDVSHVTNMSYMFANCSALTTIYCNDDWNTSTVTSSESMFSGCTVLKGGNGTECDGENNIDVTYAHLDVAANPGYFTRKFLLGDVNGDGKVDVADVTALTNYLRGITGSYNLDAADVDGVNGITIDDVRALVNIILGKN